MPLWRMQVSIAADGPLARDRFVITPHFNDTLPGSDPQGLTSDLADALETWGGFVGTREIKVTAYDAQGTPPVYPVAETIKNANMAPPTFCPRELALCLSFYSQRNLPRQRGRLYIPATFLPLGANGAQLRPSGGSRDKVAALVPIFTGLGGTDVDWVVYSRLDNQPRSVSNWWVDDEWDIIRSRGMRPTTRTSGTVSE